MWQRLLLASALVSGAAFVAGPAHAEEDEETADEGERQEPRQSPAPLRYDVGARGAFNPAVGLIESGITYRRPLYASTNPLLARNGFDLRLGIGVSLPGIRPSATLNVDPFSFLRFTAGYVGGAPFGKTGGSFTSPNDDFGRKLFSGIPTGPNGTYFRWTHRVLLGAELRGVFGRVVVRTAWKALRTDTDLNAGDRVVYDAYVDNVISAHGWAYRGDTDLGWLLGDGLRGPIVGARLTNVFVPYDDADYAPGEAQKTANSPTAKVGPWVRLPVAPDVTLTVIAQWYVRDRFHTGETTPTVIPNVGVALTARGDL